MSVEDIKRAFMDYAERREQVRRFRERSTPHEILYGEGIYIPFPEMADYLTPDEREDLGYPRDYTFTGVRTSLRHKQ